MKKILSMVNAFVLAGLLLSPSMAVALAKPKARVQKTVPFADIANVYLASFNVVVQAESDDKPKPKQKPKLQSGRVTQEEKRSLTFNAMAAHSPYRTHEDNVANCDLTFVKKMEIISGEENNTGFFSIIDRTQTMFGKAAFVRMLSRPNTNRALLEQRQAFIRALAENPQLFQELDAFVQHIKAVEDHMIGYLKPENAMNQKMFKKMYFGKMLNWFNSNTIALEAGTRLGNVFSAFQAVALPLLAGIGKEMLGSMAIQTTKDQARESAEQKQIQGQHPEPFQELYDEYQYGQITYAQYNKKRAQLYTNLKKESDIDTQVLDAAGLAAVKGAIVAGEQEDAIYPLRDGARIAKAFIVKDGDTEKVVNPSKVRLAVNGIARIPSDAAKLSKGVYSFLTEEVKDPESNVMPLKTKLLATSPLFLLVALQAYLTNSAYKKEMTKKNMANYLQDRLIGVANYVRTMKNMCHFAKANNLPVTGIEHLDALINNCGTRSASFNKLLGMLDTNTFSGSASFFSITGRVLGAHHLMQEVVTEFVPALEVAGELDAYLSMAKLYKEFASKRVHYSFVEFVDKDRPYFEAHNFWNPFVNPDFVVANDLVLGAEKRPNNVILTGPNTGGKSTVIKATILNLVLAQTFGMACADKLVITPFTNINCYLNITDDVAAGTSLFKAEVLRAKELIDSVRGLSKNQFSFTIMDEVFSGTSPKEGAHAAYMFTEQLGEFDNSMIMLATHFPTVTKLEDDHNDTFKNYQVKIIKEADGSLTRPYKLQEGKTFLNVAMDLLEEEGIFIRSKKDELAPAA